MHFKKHITVALVTGMLGVAMISGGTVAYFNDNVETNNEILSGTLDLGITNIDDDNGVLFEFNNKQPGDIFDFKFKLINQGTLDIGKVNLISEHEVVKGEPDFGNQIQVVSLLVNNEEIIPSGKRITLDDLNGVENRLLLLNRFPAGSDEVEVSVKFKFIQTKKDQNKYQGNKMDLKWTFEATQVTN